MSKAIQNILIIVGLVIVSISCSSVCANAEPSTSSPYFFVKSDIEQLDVLPLKHTEVQVDIAGVIADVTVTQVYHNRGRQPLEAIYIFPGATRAAVHGLRMTVGERVTVAEVREKKRARKIYEAAKKTGKSSSLLEQQRPNVFQMNVANIMPGDTVSVELSYTELLVPLEGEYEFVFPTVVGPRYAHAAPDQQNDPTDWISNPYLAEGEDPPFSFSLSTTIAAGMPIQQLTSPSHQVDVEFESRNKASVSLLDVEQAGSNRDYILRYRLRGSEIESGLLLYEGADENFFLLMAQPPERIVPSQIPAREYIYVVDVSGSMRGFPLDVSKALIRNLLAELRTQDRFNILLFAGSSSWFAPESQAATPENITAAMQLIDQQRGGGGTELLPAMRRALSLPNRDEVSRAVVVITDGYVAVEDEVFELIRSNLHQMNTYAFGIGSSVNRHLIEGIAKSGQGEVFVATGASEAKRLATRLKRYIEAPVLTGIELDYSRFEVYDVEPKSIPDLTAERPLLVYGKWRGDKSGVIKLSGYQGRDTYEKNFRVTKVPALRSNRALRHLWARKRIESLADYSGRGVRQEQKQLITELGLRYGLLTPYTSFVAVDKEVRNPAGDQKRVKQALPLPEGVSNSAVGGTVPTVPEPETYLLLMIMAVVLLWQLRAQLYPTAQR